MPFIHYFKEGNKVQKSGNSAEGIRIISFYRVFYVYLFLPVQIEGFDTTYEWVYLSDPPIFMDNFRLP